MEPLCHTLFGAALAETRLKRWTPLATPVALIGANLPDVDVATYVGGADVALAHRRGWTHGVLAMILLPLALAGAFLLWDRIRRRRAPDRPALRVLPLLALAAVAVWSHPALDWLNTYGVRLLMPFDGRWLYGDAVFIVDPWLWLLLGGGVFLSRRPAGRELRLWVTLALLATAVLLLAPRAVPLAAKGLWLLGLVAIGLLRRRSQGGPSATRVATVGLLLGLVYAGVMVWVGSAARDQVEDELGLELGRDRLMVGPMPANPLHWQVVAALPEEYRAGVLRLRDQTALELDRQFLLSEPSALERRALADPSVAGFRSWARFPLTQVEERGGETVIWLLDIRYAYERTTGFGGARVVLE